MQATERHAECNCGQLRATCRGEPERVSVCHCTCCKRRTGSAFAWNASFDVAQVTASGRHGSFSRVTDTGRTNLYHFCPDCGSTVFYEVELRAGKVSVPVGAFGSANFRGPDVEVFERRRVPWCRIDST